jgi:hypothetical protein
MQQKFDSTWNVETTHGALSRLLPMGDEKHHRRSVERGGRR